MSNTIFYFPPPDPERPALYLYGRYGGLCEKWFKHLECAARVAVSDLERDQAFPGVVRTQDFVVYDVEAQAPPPSKEGFRALDRLYDFVKLSSWPKYQKSGQSFA